MKLIFTLVAFFVLLMPAVAVAEGDAPKPPYFASLNEEKVYMRFGPGKNYPVKWVYSRRDLPVEVTHVYESWRKVKMPDGEFGWINQTLLSSARTAIILGKGPQVLTKKEDGKKVVARVIPGLIVALLKCSATACQVEANDQKGWISRTALWGLYAAEQIP
ncbi:MAG: SH3 domain-containing protein [Pseudomonadota bacterium]